MTGARQASNEVIMSSPCLIHQLHRSRTTMMAQMGIMSPLYCGANLLRVGNTKHACVEKLKAYVRAHTQRRHIPVSKECREYSATLVAMHKQALLADASMYTPQAGHVPPALSARAKKLDRLLELLNGDWRDYDNIVHVCEGCCASDEACVAKVEDLLLNLVFAYEIPVPAVNRWTHGQHALTQMLLWTACHGAVHASLSFSH